MATTKRPAPAIIEEAELAPERDVLEGERFWQPALVVLVIGIVLRQLWLAAFPYHPDEAIHGWFPLDLFNYKPNPVYHGPVMYYLTAFTYSLFGGIFKWLHIDIRPDNDYTARLAPSLLGIALLAIIIFGPLRRWMGARAVLWSAALLAISPSVVTYSRRTLHDALVLVLTLGALLLFQQARQSPAWSERGHAKWLGLVSLMALFLATKANVFFLVALLGAFWMATWAQVRIERAPSLQIWRGRERASKYLVWLPLFVFGVVTLFSWIYATRDGDVAHKEKIFALVVIACSGLLWLWIVLAPRHAVLDASTYESIARDDAEAAEALAQDSDLSPKERRTRTWRTSLVAAWCGVLVFAWFSGHGYLWWKVPVEMVSQPQAFARKASVSIAQIRDAATGKPIQTETLEATLGPWMGQRMKLPGGWKPTDSKLSKMSDVEALDIQQTGGGQDWDDVTMSVPRMVAYWSNQQKNPRLPGRHDYYLTLILLYEFPIALAALGGIWYVSKNRSSWGDLLLWWAFLSWALYAMANEKVPWLLVHLILPFSLLGGWWLSRLWASWAARERGELPALGALCAIGAVFLLRNTSATNFERAVVHREPMFYAQTSEEFRDEMMRSLVKSSVKTGDVWLHNDKQWPAAWYFRTKSPLLMGQSLSFGSARPADAGTDRMLITTPEDWAVLKKQPAWKDWQGTEVTHYIWPRVSWPALAPGRFILWWIGREGTPDDEKPKPQPEWKKSILSAPGGEWSDSKAVFVTPKG
jgi:predicted membrane-bound mannosyltransferase